MELRAAGSVTVSLPHNVHGHLPRQSAEAEIGSRCGTKPRIRSAIEICVCEDRYIYGVTAVRGKQCPSAPRRWGAQNAFMRIACNVTDDSATAKWGKNGLEYVCKCVLR
jgi:hypothetical protein